MLIALNRNDEQRPHDVGFRGEEDYSENGMSQKQDDSLMGKNRGKNQCARFALLDPLTLPFLFQFVFINFKSAFKYSWLTMLMFHWGLL